jgi:hypothetical protein
MSLIPFSSVGEVPLQHHGLCKVRQLPFFAKKGRQVRMIMIIIAMRSGKPMR